METRKPRDWEHLKTQGKVDEWFEEGDGFITITRTFISHDGKTKFMEVSSGPTINAHYERICDIDAAIKHYEQVENYEKCQELLNERNQILDKQI